MIGWLATVAAIARRELAAYFHAPIAYVVGVLFLVAEGFSFWAVVELLADPARRPPPGAVLENHFGGSMLYWAILFLLVAVIAMRLVAEEKRQGTWEALLTTPATEGAVLVGKWLGAVAFYTLLWLPTSLHLLFLALYAPTGATIDPGPIASAYLGVIASGSGFLALGLAASAATRNQIIAAMLTFVILLGLLLFGQLAELTPAWLELHPGLAATVEFVDLRGHMGRFAAGEIGLGPLLFYGALIATGLAAALALAAMGRRRPSELQGRWLATGLIATICVLVSILAGRHPRWWDLTGDRANSLAPASERLLAAVDRPVDLLMIRPAIAEFDGVYVEVDRLLERMVARQPLLHRRDLDPAREPERIESLAAEFAIAVGDLVDGGAVVLQAGERRRVVDLLDMAEFDRDDLGVGSLSRFGAEAALVEALVELVEVDRPIICATSGHGELGPDPGRQPHWQAIADRLRRDGARVELVGQVAAGVPSYCRVLMVFGPAMPLPAAEAVAVADYLAAGGGLFLAVTDGGGGRSPKTGLELVVADFGVRVSSTVAIDEPRRIELAGAWMTIDSYGDHPISAGFQHRRPTVWQRPRAIEIDPAAGGVPLVTAPGAAGSPAIAVAVAPPSRPGRLVVFGSASSLSSALGDRGLGVNDLLAAAAISWLAGARRGGVAIDDRIPANLRLLMTRSQLRTTFIMVVVVIPGGLMLVGLLVWRRRRRG